MGFEFLSTNITGLYLVNNLIFHDSRGFFIKTFHFEKFKEKGIDFVPKESYFSVSHKDVIRGMHFQIPPFEHYKMTTVIKGEILDVVLDLRKNSTTFGNYFKVMMTDSHLQTILIPPGCAHGFLSLQNESIISYSTTTTYSPEHDLGIHFNSFGFEWPVKEPILSSRDQSFPRFNDFNTPFV